MNTSIRNEDNTYPQGETRDNVDTDDLGTHAEPPYGERGKTVIPKVKKNRNKNRNRNRNSGKGAEKETSTSNSAVETTQISDNGSAADIPASPIREQNKSQHSGISESSSNADDKRQSGGKELVVKSSQFWGNLRLST
jgi:hypothetical protein